MTTISGASIVSGGSFARPVDERSRNNFPSREPRFPRRTFISPVFSAVSSNRRKLSRRSVSPPVSSRSVQLACNRFFFARLCSHVVSSRWKSCAPPRLETVARTLFKTVSDTDWHLPKPDARIQVSPFGKVSPALLAVPSIAQRTDVSVRTRESRSKVVSGQESCKSCVLIAKSKLISKSKRKSKLHHRHRAQRVK